MARWIALFAVLGIVSSLVAAADEPAKCSAGNNCPENTPCCSQYGVCGIGGYCLGGCDPRYSHSIDSCMPAPQCQSKTYTFKNITKSLADYTAYLGDPKEADWTYSGYPLQYGDNALLTMPANSAGSVIMSTSYVWYGKVSATLKTARGQGVVTAFIFMSDVKDEIDYEFVGKDLTTAQTNIYWEALPYYGNTGNISDITDTFAEWHTYTVDWTEDEITWSVDGKTHRTKTRASTWNDTSKLYNYPQTPARVQLSLWPGGASTQAKGTIDWAGGPIDWSGSDIQNSGYYYMQVSKVEVQCYDPPSGAAKDGSGDVSYIFQNGPHDFINSSVILSGKGTVLKSQLGSGTNTTAAPSGTASATSGADPNAGNVGTGSGDGNRGSGSSSSSSGDGTSFSQGNGSSSEASGRYSRIVAVWSAVVGLAVGGVFVLL